MGLFSANQQNRERFNKDNNTINYIISIIQFNGVLDEK